MVVEWWHPNHCATWSMPKACSHSSVFNLVITCAMFPQKLLQRPPFIALISMISRFNLHFSHYVQTIVFVSYSSSSWLVYKVVQYLFIDIFNADVCPLLLSTGGQFLMLFSLFEKNIYFLLSCNSGKVSTMICLPEQKSKARLYFRII